MLDLFQSSKAIGLEYTSNEIKAAEMSIKGGTPQILRLLSFPINDAKHDLKDLDKHHPFFVTAMESSDVLVRPLYLPLTKKKDIDAALPFQVEPLLPYPLDQALLSHQILEQNSEGSQATIFATNKKLLEAHLEQWKNFAVEPEQVASVQSALCQFSQTYLPGDAYYILFHLSDTRLTGILVKNGKLIVSYSHQEGLNLLYEAAKKDPETADMPFVELDEHLHSEQLENAITQIQKGLSRICLALTKEAKGEKIEGFLMTGDIVLVPTIKNLLAERLNIPLITPHSHDERSTDELELYALPIGMALSSLSTSTENINFRQHDLSYPHPWKRVQVPLALYIVFTLLASLVFYYFSHHYLLYQEDLLKQRYVELLAGMGKSYHEFESTFLSKNPSDREKFNGEVVNITQLDREDLLKRTEYLQKDLQDTPDSFPLFANIPRVSDVLAWLNNHPYVVSYDPDGNVEHRIQLESFSYTVLKRPSQERKQEKYQVKVEFEFSSPIPKWAREFHDALITPNDFVDPKGEVKWSSNRGLYRTSFYLKDKTSYPSF